MATLERAVIIAMRAHEGQRDKGGQPYILHVFRVVGELRTDAARIVGALHDVVEDSEWTLDMLRREGFAEELVTAVEAITRRRGEPYEDYMDRVLVNPLACEVKRVDLEDNLNVTRLAVLGNLELERLSRYHRAWRRLVPHDGA